MTPHCVDLKQVMLMFRRVKNRLSIFEPNPILYDAIFCNTNAPHENRTLFCMWKLALLYSFESWHKFTTWAQLPKWLSMVNDSQPQMQLKDIWIKSKEPTIFINWDETVCFCVLVWLCPSMCIKLSQCYRWYHGTDILGWGCFKGQITVA